MNSDYSLFVTFDSINVNSTLFPSPFPTYNPNNISTNSNIRHYLHTNHNDTIYALFSSVYSIISISCTNET